MNDSRRQPGITAPLLYKALRELASVWPPCNGRPRLALFADAGTPWPRAQPATPLHPRSAPPHNDMPFGLGRDGSAALVQGRRAGRSRRSPSSRSGPKTPSAMMTSLVPPYGLNLVQSPGPARPPAGGGGGRGGGGRRGRRGARRAASRAGRAGHAVRPDALPQRQGPTGGDKSDCHLRKTATDYDRKPGITRLSCTAK